MKNFEKFLTKKNIFLLVLIVVLLYFSDVFTGSMREGNAANISQANKRQHNAYLKNVDDTIINIKRFATAAPDIRQDIVNNIVKQLENLRKKLENNTKRKDIISKGKDVLKDINELINIALDAKVSKEQIKFLSNAKKEIKDLID